MGKLSSYTKYISEPFILAVQKGKMPGHSFIQKYGSNYVLPADVTVDCWEYGGIEATARTYTPIAFSGEELYFSSSNDSDDQTIAVYLLDVNGEEVVKTFSLAGQTKTALDAGVKYTAVNRMLNTSTTATAGNVFLYTDSEVTAGVPATKTAVKAYFSIAGQQTKQAIYTVPRNKDGYLIGIFASIANKQAGNVTAFPRVSALNTAGTAYTTWRQLPEAALNPTGTGATSIQLNFIPLPPGEIFKMSCQADTAGMGLSSFFDILLSEVE